MQDWNQAVWSARPLLLDKHFTPVWSDGLRGQRWDEEWVFDKVDDGAFRIKLHSDYDGLLITIALQSREGGAIHPYTIVIDNPDRQNESTITHANRLLTRVNGFRFPRSQPAWVWVRFLFGRVWVGFGPNVGQNCIMQARTPDALGGGYNRFAVGKTGNNGAFEVLDAQPLERRPMGNYNTRGVL
jgi:hypothetical protein